MILLAIQLLFLKATVNQQPITLDESCIAPIHLMKKLSDLTGVKLAADKSISPEPLELHVQGVAIQDLMAHLAEAEAGEWIDKDGTLTLRRSIARVEAERKERIEAAKSVYLDEVRALSQDLDVHPHFGKEEADELAAEYKDHVWEVNQDHSPRGGATFIHDLNLRLPVGRAVARLLKALPLEAIFNCPDDSEVVFSSNPTSTQIAFPVDVKPILRQLYFEESEWRKAINAVPPLTKLQDPTEFFVRRKSLSEPSLDEKLLLNVYGLRVRSFAPLGISLLDKDGHTVDGIGVFLKPLKEPSHESYSRESTVPTANDILLQPAEIESIKVFNSIYGLSHPDPKKISVPLKFALLHPNIVPTASLFAGPMIGRVAQSVGKNSIAVLSDYLTIDLASLSDRNLASLHHLEYWLDKPGFHCKYIDKDGWVTLRPRDFAEVEQAREDLPAMAQLLQQVDKLGYVPAEGYAKFCSVSSYQAVRGSTLFQRYLSAFNRNFDFLFWHNNFDLWKLYGLLTPSQRAKAQTGLPVSEFTPDELMALNNFVYQEQPALNPGANPAPKLPDEITEVFPEGFSSAAYLKLHTDHWKLLFTQYVKPEEGTGFEPISPSTFIIVRGPEPKIGPDVKFYQKGEYDRVSFDIRLSAKVALHEVFAEERHVGKPIINEKKTTAK